MSVLEQSFLFESATLISSVVKVHDLRELDLVILTCHSHSAAAHLMYIRHRVRTENLHLDTMEMWPYPHPMGETQNLNIP